MKSIAVFCGSSAGVDPAYTEGAKRLGEELAKRGITLIYGGACVGIMGAVADAVLASGGKAIGVMPRFLSDREIAHQGLTELITVETMHERKQKMISLADGFIALPGGPGTMEEFFEAVTWSQIGLHQKPCGLLNLNGYFDGLLEFFQHMVRQQFMKETYLDKLIAGEDPVMLLDAFAQHVPPEVKTYQTQ